MAPKKTKAAGDEPDLFKKQAPQEPDLFFARDAQEPSRILMPSAPRPRIILPQKAQELALSNQKTEQKPDRPPSPKSLRLIEESLAIEAQDARDAGAVGFMARALVQATIPHTDPGNDVQVWSRSNGDLSLSISPYWGTKDGKPYTIGYPYGTKPRLVLAWLSTEAVRTQSPEINLGNSLSSFMRELKLDPTGGKNGSITSLQDQLKRLFSAHISINYSSATGDGGWGLQRFNVTNKATIWWDPMKPEQKSHWQSKVVLSNEFFREIVEHPVPIDLRAMRALRQGPLALDVYIWMTYRLFYLKRTTLIPWETLSQQFGVEFKEIRHFRRRFNEALAQVNTVYPVKTEATHEGLRIYPGKTHIQRIGR